MPCSYPLREMLRMTLLSNAVNQRLCVWVDAYLKECCISLTLEKEALFIGARGPLIPWEGLRTPEPFLIKGGERMVVFPITQIQKLQEQSFHWAKAETHMCWNVEMQTVQLLGAGQSSLKSRNVEEHLMNHLVILLICQKLHGKGLESCPELGFWHMPRCLMGLVGPDRHEVWAEGP